MPVDFPASPATNQIYSYNNRAWIWNGSAWLSAQPSVSIGNTFSSGRLTISSGNPVPTSNFTNTVLYYTPYAGNMISLYDGTNWATYSFTEISLSLSALGAQNLDIFMYKNGGTLTLESAAWASNTARATALVLTNGVYLKSGALTRRYLGTIRTSGGFCYDNGEKKHIWNYNNRVNCRLFKQYAASSWTYATANTYRYAGNNSANSIEIVNGIQEDNIFVMATCGSAGSGIQRQLALGFNTEWSASLAGNSTTAYESTAVQNEASNETYHAFANRYPAIGNHTIYALEFQNSASTVNYFAGVESGITANWRC
jgi:hypothetical protein